MRTITLKEAYSHSPTRPLLNNDQHRIQPNLGILVNCIAEDHQTAAILVHAYNELPEVLSKLEWIVGFYQPGDAKCIVDGEVIKQAQATITKANQVQIP